MTTITSRNNNHSHHHRGHLPSHSTNHFSGTLSQNSLNNIIAHKRKPWHGSVVTCPTSHTEFAVVEHQGLPTGTTLISTLDPLARIPHSRCLGVEEEGTPVPLPPRLVKRWRRWSQTSSTLKTLECLMDLAGEGPADNKHATQSREIVKELGAA